MTYPIIPLTPTWENSAEEKADIASTRYGDGGVEARTTKGINPITTTWDIQVTITNFADVDAFLKAQEGTPFQLSLDGGVTTDGNLYICQEYQIEQLGLTAATFNGKFQQVRRFS